ncbi:DUF1376 domain-containing protein, partial [Candidatus Parcubacteria bacterium]
MEVRKMAKGKSPAFQFYPADFLSDGKVCCMTLEEIGAYMILLCHCWLEDGLPNEEKKLQKFLKISKKKFQKIQKNVLDCFQLDEEKGRLFNPRLLKEKQQQIENSKKRKLAAEK